MDKEKRIEYVENELSGFKKTLQLLNSKSDINFEDSKNYFIDFIDGKYQPITNKKTLSNWKKQIFLEREEDIKNRIKQIEQIKESVNI